MTGEDIVDCIMELDSVLGDAELSLQKKDYAHAIKQLREARAVINDLRQEDCATDDKEIEMHVMNELK